MFVRFTATVIALVSLFGLSMGTVQAEPITLIEPAVALYTANPSLCNQQLDGANGSVTHSGAEINGVAGADYRMHIEQQTTAGWEPMGRGHLMAWVNGTLGDPEALQVPSGAQFRIFVVQSSGGTARGAWRLVVEGPTTQGTTLGSNLTPIASDVTAC